MRPCYISVDVEATGPIPGKYSMLSLGACVVGDEKKQFYKEIQPISDNFLPENLRIGCLELKCLDFAKQCTDFDPRHTNFSPYKTMQYLIDNTEMTEPKKAMINFAKWIKKVSDGRTPIEVASPIKFDGMYTSWYFDVFLGNNPLGFSGIDINSIYKGIHKNMQANPSRLDIPNPRKHHALEDAIQQAKEFKYVLKLMRQ